MTTSLLIASAFLLDRRKLVTDLLVVIARAEYSFQFKIGVQPAQANPVFLLPNIWQVDIDTVWFWCVNAHHEYLASAVRLQDQGTN